MKIIHLSDLHNGEFKWFGIIKEENPDIIVCTGDMISRNTVDFQHIYRVLKTLTKIAPVLYSLGNHELTLSYINFKRLEFAVKKSGAIWLDNETFCFKGIFFTGATLKSTVYRKYIGLDGVEKMTPEVRERIVNIVQNKEKMRISYRDLDYYTAEELGRDVKKPNGYTILLAHNPMFFKEYAKWGADIVLSGHIHGGLFRLPFFGGVLSPERKFFPKYDKGVYKLGEHYMHVSVGLSKFRFFNPPEIGIVTI
jgi:predicted MPP superfamily phosphohydrolase